MHCPNCKTQLLEKRGPLIVCQTCHALLYIDKNHADQVHEKRMNELHWNVSAINKLMCNSVAGHNWSEEGYIKADDPHDCVKSMVCKRCYRVYSRKTGKHQFVTEYIRDGSCDKQRICFACGHTETFTEHTYVIYVKDGTCEEERRCSRCGEVQRLGRVEHRFGEWGASGDHPCKKIRICRRCGKQDEIIEHAGEWVVTGSENARSDGTEKMISEERTCTRCGEKEYEERYWESPWA